MYGSQSRRIEQFVIRKKLRHHPFQTKMATLPKMSDGLTATFIDKVESLPCLWQTRCTEFHNRVVVQNAWEAVASSFQMTSIFATARATKNMFLLDNSL